MCQCQGDSYIAAGKVIRNFRNFLSVLRGHSVFSSPPQRPMTSDFEGFSIPDFIHDIYFPILILERKSQYFPFWMLSAKQGNYWYHFYNVFGMTRSLTGDWTRDHTTRLSRRWCSSSYSLVSQIDVFIATKFITLFIHCSQLTTINTKLNDRRV